MEYRHLGRSGLKVSVLSFGAATFGGGNEFFRAWGASDVADATRLLDICFDAGVNLFDTANVYSRGLSEEILGKALGNRRQQALISTKATFPMGDGPNDKGSSRYHLLRQCDESLRRLGTDYIDIYHLHGFDARTPIEETLHTLDTLVCSGKVRYIACSNFSGWHLMKSLDISEKYGWARYVAHQVYYSLVGRDFEWELMPLGIDQGVGSLIWSPLGWGRLTGKIRRNQPFPEVSRLHKTAEQAPPIGDEYLYKVVDALDLSRQGNREVSTADRFELAVAAAHRIERDHRRTQRRAVAPEPRRHRLEFDAGAGKKTRRSEHGYGRLPLLASTPVRGLESRCGIERTRPAFDEARSTVINSLNARS